MSDEPQIVESRPLTYYFLLYDTAPGLLLGVLLYFNDSWYRSLVPGAMKGAIYSTLTQVFASLLGFIITAISILIALHLTKDSHIISEMRKKEGPYSQIFRAYVNTCWVLGFGVIVAMSALVCDTSATNTMTFFAIVIPVIAVVAVFRIARCIWILGTLISTLIGASRD